MAPSSRDRISVDLRGFKASLFDEARARGMSPSGLVRDVLTNALREGHSVASDRVATDVLLQRGDRARLCLRMSREEALATLAAARQSGLPPGAYVANLMARVPAVSGGASRTEHLGALIASTAELPILSRNIRHLTTLLSQGEVAAARAYREMLDTLDRDIRRHLTLASHVLADLRPRRGADRSPRPTT
jgi:hypothetical protein